MKITEKNLMSYIYLNLLQVSNICYLVILYVQNSD